MILQNSTNTGSNFYILQSLLGRPVDNTKCVCACVRACVRACMRACVCVSARSAPVLDLEGLLLVDAVHVGHGAGLEEGVQLHRHAEPAEHHVGAAVLGAERLVGHLQTRGAVHRAVDPGDLPQGKPPRDTSVVPSFSWTTSPESCLTSSTLRVLKPTNNFYCSILMLVNDNMLLVM